MMLRTSALLFSLFLFLLPTIIVATCVHTFQDCGSGCWHENNVVLLLPALVGLRRICTPVGQGYFSGSDDNDRHACPGGTYSDDLEGIGCLTCPAGSASGGNASSCVLCPPGFYQEIAGQSTCKQCSTDLFDGSGSNDFVYDLQINTVFCSLRKDNGDTRAPSRSTTLQLCSSSSMVPHHANSVAVSSAI